MSKNSNSQNQTKNSTTIGSMCPSNSESFRQSGLADTSAGSGAVSANSSTPMTAKVTNSPKPTNDLPGGSFFGGQGGVPQQTQPQQTTHPASCTNVTFENTDKSTGPGSSNGKPSKKSPKSGTSDSTRTAIPISAKIQVTVDVQIAAGEPRTGTDKQVQVDTNMPTQMSSVGTPLAFEQKSEKSGFAESTKTGIPVSTKNNMPTQMRSVGEPLAFGQKSGFAEQTKNAGCSPKPRPRSPAQQIEAIKKQQQMDEAANKDLLKKSMSKSQKSATGSCGRMSGISQKSMKSARSRKSGKAHGIVYCPALKSQKSQKTRKVINKDNGCQNTSVYMPGVMDGNASNQGPSTFQKSQRVQNRSVYLYDKMDDKTAGSQKPQEIQNRSFYLPGVMDNNAAKQFNNQGPSTSQKSQKIQNTSVYMPGVMDGNTTMQFNNQGSSQKSQKIQNTSFYMPGVMNGNTTERLNNQGAPQKSQKPQNRSSYLPGVMDCYTTERFNNQGASQKSTKSSRVPNNQIPRADKSTWNMNQVKPTAPIAQAPNYCVYDVSELSATQRRFPSTFGSTRAPSPNVGTRNLNQSSQRCPKPVINPFCGAPTSAAPSVPAPVIIRPPQTAAPTATNTKIHGLDTNQSSQRYPKPVVNPFAGAPTAAAPYVPAPPSQTAAPSATNTKIHGFDTIQNSQACPESVALDSSTVGPPAQQSLQTRAAPTTTTTITIYGKKVDESQSSQKLSQPVIPPMAEALQVRAPPTASAPIVPASSVPVAPAPVAPAPVVLPASTTPAQPLPQAAAPTTNSKIVIFGKTADGKNTIQMTIDMQIVAGEALAGSDKPIQVIPQKILLAGKEFTLDGFSKRGDTPPQ